MTARIRARGVDPTVLLWLVIFIPLGLALMASLRELPERDGAIFMYVGEGLLDGELPYADRWDHKPPLIFVINAVARLLTPDGFTGIMALELLFIATWMVLGFLALRPAFGLHATLFSLALVLAALDAVLGRGNYTEEFALLPQFAALYLFVRLRGSKGLSRRSVIALLAVGALGAAAFMLRANLVGLWLVIGIYWLVWDDARWRKLGWSVVGGSVALATAALLIAVSGFFGDFVDAAFVFNSIYSDTGGLSGWLGNVPTTWLAIPFALPATLIWLLGAGYIVRQRHTSGAAVVLVRLAVLWAPLELLLIAMSGRDYSHYFLALLPVLSILLGFAGATLIRTVEWLLERFRPGSRHDSRRLGAALVPVVVLLLLSTPVAISYSIVPLIDGPSSVAKGRDARTRYTVARIEELTEADDSILVWGAEPQLYLMTGRSAPTRFFFQHPLVFKGYGSSELIAEFMDDLAADPPELIIDTRNARLPPLAPERRVDWHPRGAQYQSPPGALDEFFELVEREYTLLDKPRGYWIYQRTGQGSE